MMLPEHIFFLLWILLCMIVISLFCVGLRAITDEERIFYFLRKPYDMIEEKAEKWLTAKLKCLDECFKKAIMEEGSDIDILKEHIELLVKAERQSIRSIKIKQELLKPIIGCVTCFASFWGTILFWSLNLLILPYSHELLAVWPIVCIGSAFFNQYLWIKIS